MHHRLSQLYARTVFYPTLGWNYALARFAKIRNWWDRIDPHVIVGAFPFSRDVAAMHAAGVRAVVNTCEEYAGPHIEYDRLGIEQLHIPTTDFTHPRLDDVSLAVEFVQRHVEAGETVYIHCKAGRARSATVAMCWLMKYRGLTADQAQHRLLAARPHINPRLTQRAVVQQFADLLITDVFVYGTLKQGQSRSGLWPAQPLTIQPGWAHGTLLGRSDYPAMIAGSDRVLGEVWHFALSEMTNVLKTLDAIEGTNQPGQPDLYKRVAVDTYGLEGDRVVKAYTYFYATDPAQDGFVMVDPESQDNWVQWP